MEIPSVTNPLTVRKQRIALLFEEIITNGRLELADDIFAEYFFWPQFQLHGPEGVRSWVRAFRTAFPTSATSSRSRPPRATWS